MNRRRVVFRWPENWKDASLLGLLRNSAINCVIFDRDYETGSLISKVAGTGLAILASGAWPSGVTVVKGEWPGVKLTESGAIDRSTAGPTGVPWVDSNGWRIRLAGTLQPDIEIWVDAVPPQARLSADDYAVAVADAAAHGGTWIIALDAQLAARIAAGDADATGIWGNIKRSAAFFAEHDVWTGYVPRAVVGIASDFSGHNEEMSRELLNLVTRTNQQYRILPKDRIVRSSLEGLRAVLYADEEAPRREVRNCILAFVNAGGMLITGPKWGKTPGASVAPAEHPRYTLERFGKGTIAVATPDFDDPFVVANDSNVLISHRHDLLRFWNAGAAGSYFTTAPDGLRSVVHMLFYALPYWSSAPSVRIAGRYRSARLWAPDLDAPRQMEMHAEKDAVELHLPRVRAYAAVELENLAEDKTDAQGR